MKIFNEDYIGKVPNIQAIEDIFSKYVNKKGTINSVPFVRNEGKIVTKIEELLCKEFNFEEIILCFEPSSIDNGFTVFCPVGSIFDDIRGISYDIKRNSNGGFSFKDKRNKIACIVISANFLENSSPEEVMGILLHEVGHQFNKILFVNKVFFKIFSWFFVKSGTKSFINHIKNKKANQASRDKRIQKIEAEVNKRLGDDATIITTLRVQENSNVESPKKDQFIEFVTFSILFSVITACSIILIPLSLLNLMNLFSFFERYKGEIDADRFAYAYGYSKGVSKFLTNNFSISKSLNKTGIKADKDFIIEIERKVHNFLSALYLTDEHPTSFARAKNALKYLDEEINSTKNPRIKKILQKQKKETEEVIKDYCNRLNKKEIDTSMDDIKREYTYKFAGSESYEQRAK